MSKRDAVREAYRAAEATAFPPVPDDKVYCPVRGKIVGSTECATDACVAPEQRVVCWEGHVAVSFEDPT